MFKVIKQDKCIIFVFWLSFSIYLITAFLLSRDNIFNTDIYFGADNARVFKDIVQITGNHYRIKVHPLFLILVQPIALLLNGIIHDGVTTICFLQAFIGAANVTLLWVLLNKLNSGNLLINIVFTVMFTFSFSNLLFVSIPETYLYAALFIILFWLYVFSNYKNTFNTKFNLLMLTFFGITLFGITLTNYFQYIIGLIFLLNCTDKSKKKKIQFFIFQNVINFMIILILSWFQSQVWRGTPLFASSLLDALFNKNNFEEYRYMDSHITLSKLKVVLENIFGYSILVPTINFDPAKAGNNFSFGQYLPAHKIAMGFFAILSTCSCLSFHKKYWRKKNLYSLFTLSLEISLLWNFGIHLFYGYNQSFIYSQHYLFLTITTLCVYISEIQNKVIKKISYYLTYLYTGFIVINNSLVFISITKTASEFAGNNDFNILCASLLPISLLLIVGLIYIVCHYIILSKWCFNIKKFCLKSVYIYTILIIISSVFIIINYYKS